MEIKVIIVSNIILIIFELFERKVGFYYERIWICQGVYDAVEDQTAD